MAEKLTLDAMIQRADFAIGASEAASMEEIPSISLESLSSNSMLVPMLRKPDFQRETNQWTQAQIVNFLRSYLDRDLIPSVILWRSPAFVFVIDGGHRLSALRAWIEDDYGDGLISQKYYGNEISTDQKRIADRVRKIIAAEIGTYKQVKDALFNPDTYPALTVQRARSMGTRPLSLQWVVGDAEKAENSFFKINTQGTPLDNIEELLLKNRRRPVAIAARSIFRAGTGHKYWSSFNDIHAAEIVQISKEINQLIFKPDLIQPIKTLQLPLGGGVSPINALELLLKLVTLSSTSQSKPFPKIEDFPEDLDGSATVQVLKNCHKIMSWLTGNGPSSLGLHPAVYFYNDQGRHSADMLLAFVSLVARKVAQNEKQFFNDFTTQRSKIETFLIVLKPYLAILINAVTSRSRVQKLAEFLERMVAHAKSGKNLDVSWAVEQIAPNSRAKILNVTATSEGTVFSKETKSDIFLKESLQHSIKCHLCQGLLEPTISVSYDHDMRVREGGDASAENGKLTHPYCNTGYKN